MIAINQKNDSNHFFQAIRMAVISTAILQLYVSNGRKQKIYKYMNLPQSIEAKLRKLICQCIKEHNVLWFYYESDSGKYWRKVDPYILAVYNSGKGNTYFTGYVYPSKEAKKKNDNNNQGQYLLNKIDFYQFEISGETFNELKLDYDKIFGELPTIKILCRVVFE
jgi:hypothetical protein